MDQKRQINMSFIARVGDWVDERLCALFSFRQIVLRSEGRVKCLNLTPRVQGFIASVFLACASWVAYATAGVFVHEMQLAAKDAEVADVRVAYRSLLGEVADYQKRFSGVVRNLEENQAMMMKLAGRNTKIQKDLTSLKTSRQARADVERARSKMTAQLGDVEVQIKSLAERNFSLKDDMASIETDLQDALRQRNTALLESTQMRHDIKVLENKLVLLEDKENNTVARLTDQSDTFIAGMESIIEMTGLDVTDLMSGDSELVAGQGGPFIAFKPDNRPGGRLKSKLDTLENKLAYTESLQKVIKKLPFAPPLQGFYMTSKFGKRRDPVNGRWSMHYGLDFGSSPHAPILVTAPGTVVYAGWKGSYGKFIEVNHGAGIKTRYAHLSKIYVKKGQKVQFGEKIGRIGSTGRSTGSHLHYEIMFRDKGLNPMQFIKAGRNVFQE